MERKTFIMIVAVVLIITSIIYLQKMKVSVNEKDENYTINIGKPSSFDSNKDIYPKAIELVSPNGYLNIENISIRENIGKKVILVDFWTYSCINCQRTIPYLNSWYDKYKDAGLIIIGVHTPEFEFEKDYENVKKAIAKHGIKYPVVQDNEYKTWRAYKNRYWPRKYLIDIDGFIVYDHIGEGGYEETEHKIQELLEERKSKLKMQESIDKNTTKIQADTDHFLIRTPEIYFGYDFARNQLGNKEGWQEEKEVDYSLPSSNRENDRFYLSGVWKNNRDNMQLVSKEGKILLKYKAKQINLVAGADKQVNLSIFIDGKSMNNTTIQGYDLYTLWTSNLYEEHEIEIKAAEGLKAYTFTFG